MYPSPSFSDFEAENPGVAIDGIDLDSFLEDMSAPIKGPARRTGPPRRRTPKHGSHDHQEAKEPKVELVLYTSAESEKSRRAVRTVNEVLKRYDASQIRFSTCDLSQRPTDAEVDAVVFTPTLVKQSPGPRTSIIGNLEREDVLCELLDASGVDRRWDD